MSNSFRSKNYQKKSHIRSGAFGDEYKVKKKKSSKKISAEISKNNDIDDDDDIDDDQDLTKIKGESNTESCQKLINEAKDDLEKQFKVGVYNIEGKNGFEKNVEEGKKWLLRSIDNGNSEAAFYYCKILINERKFDEAKSLFENCVLNSRVLVLKGLIEQKKGDDEAAFNLFFQAAKLGNSEAMFLCGKMKGEGKGTNKDEESSKEFFELASLNGINESEEYLPKNIDIVFLIDGMETMENFVDCFKLALKTIDSDCKNSFSDYFFKFGIVFYRDTVISKSRLPKISVKDLTDDTQSLIDFVNSYKVGGGMKKMPRDWISGYECLLSKINWTENAQKVVIQIEDSPDHFSITDFDIQSKYQKVFKKIQKEKYVKIRENQAKKCSKVIKKLASEKILFFCINGSEYALESFAKIRESYLNCGGPKFIIKDIFGFCNYEGLYVDRIKLQQLIKEFALQAVQISCGNKCNEDSFNEEFKQDLDEYLNYGDNDNGDSDNDDSNNDNSGDYSD